MLTEFRNTPPGQGKFIPGGDLLHSDEAPPQPGVEAGDNDFGNGDEGRDGAQSEDWLQRAREAYQFSTQYLDANYRKKWEDSIRAFNNQHPLDSKYVNPAYAKRSTIYKPKIRSVIRKNEAAAAAAFFSNMDVVSTEAENQANKEQRASADVMKQLLQYRLTKSIPWFLNVIGGYQDAQTTGAVCAHVYWNYNERASIDKPCLDLVPVENLRIDAGASWVDPINTSPYVIHCIPMYFGDIKEMMTREDPKTGRPKWYSYDDGMLRQAIQQKSDSTRMARSPGREDPYDQDNATVSDYEIGWVQRHIHKRDGIDVDFYVLGEGVALLSDPVPLKETEFHGQRPYVLGVAVLETHKIFPASVPELGKGISDEINAIANSRLDNIYLVLNKKWFVRRGKNVDIPALMRNVPGGAVMMDNVGNEGDVQEVNWPDVTQSSAEEQNRLQADSTDLLGDFSPAQAALLKNRREPARNTQMAAVASNPIVEYQLRTYVVTFVEPVLRLLAKLEQEYETDQVVLSLAGAKAKLFERYGMSEVTDQLLNQDLTVNVNIGMGATEPHQKLQRFLQANLALAQVAEAKIPGQDLSEVAKEVYGLSGYQDGTRFFQSEDPEKDRLRGAIQHMNQIMQEMGRRLESKDAEIQSKEKQVHETNVTKLLVEDLKKGDKDIEDTIKKVESDIQMGNQKRDMNVEKALGDLSNKVQLALVNLQADSIKKEAGRAAQHTTNEAKLAAKATPSRAEDVKESKDQEKKVDTALKEIGKGLEMMAEALKLLAKPTTSTATVTVNGKTYEMKKTEKVA